MVVTATTRHFECEMCRCVYKATNTAEEVGVEFARDFPLATADDLASLCDGCHSKFLELMKRRWGHAPPYTHHEKES